jgi:hypothetical protein
MQLETTVGLSIYISKTSFSILRMLLARENGVYPAVA